MKALQIIESAYRCTIEEQDDPAVWITHAMKGAGADLGVVLRANAVNYAVKNQDASGLVFGSLEQSQPPRIDQDIAALMDKNIDVYVLEEDCTERGIPSADFISGIQFINREQLPEVMEQYDQIWHW